jgi:sulfur-oxidizing protein SoxZ
MKIRTRADDGATLVQFRIDHPMETGQRVDPKTKEKVPAHFIQTIMVDLNGKPAAVINAGAAVSRDPLLSVRLKGTKAGDTVKVTWQDTKGGTESAEAKVD